MTYDSVHYNLSVIVNLSITKSTGFHIQVLNYNQID